MTKQLEEDRNNFLLDLRASLKRNQLVVIILYNSEKDEYIWEREYTFNPKLHFCGRYL